MTLVQTTPHPADSATETVTDAMDAPGPQVWDDMTVEVALSVMTSARSGHLLVYDEDGRCTGLIAQAQLNVVRDSSAYTDRVRLRDIFRHDGPFTSPMTTIAEAERTMRHGRLAALPVIDEQGCAVGILALSR
ncbi:CBS domain-containing protein [Streptomyces rhizosphaericus]|uniref:CBS domain-containing protein n=1 Tax=Streptomyces rhizosphaericus TaxID=114699 RepID=A0A6G4AIE3_9ACTN|nr:CBS domain-containing protein [Streptomyces rhizosphaericus]NEW73008.1 CBS domain-containing protein [Streptomyces rhizosphaericus]